MNCAARITFALFTLVFASSENYNYEKSTLLRGQSITQGIRSASNCAAFVKTTLYHAYHGAEESYSVVVFIRPG